MNRKLSRALKFAARTSHAFIRVSRKLLASAVSVLFALSSASALFPSTVSAHAFPTIPPSPAPASVSGQCSLQSARGEIKHVIYIQFDNVHFTRDNPNVPSDLEQMPHLLNFFVTNGTFSTNHHTPLIAHTADDILTSLTGVYGERHGQPVSNTFNYFNPASSDGLGSTYFPMNPAATLASKPSLVTNMSSR